MAEETLGAVGTGLSITGQVLGAKAQSSAIGKAQSTVSQGLGDLTQFRQGVADQGQAWQQKADTLFGQVQNDNIGQLPYQMSPAAQRAALLLGNNAAAQGQIGSGANASAMADLTAMDFSKEADRRRALSQGLLGMALQQGDYNTSLQADTLGKEQAVRQALADLSVQKGAVKGGMWNSAFGTAGQFVNAAALGAYGSGGGMLSPQSYGGMAPAAAQTVNVPQYGASALTSGAGPMASAMPGFSAGLDPSMLLAAGAL